MEWVYKSNFAGKILRKNSGKKPIQELGSNIAATEAYKNTVAIPTRKNNMANFSFCIMNIFKAGNGNRPVIRPDALSNDRANSYRELYRAGR